MAISLKQHFFLTVLLLSWALVSTTVEARTIPSTRSSTLTARLQLDNSYKCWESLIELRACTGEVILFFLNGETYLGPNCCRAIRVIEHQCWPSMLSSLGFTDQEGDVLRDYCDASMGATPPSPPSPSSIVPIKKSESKPMMP
ncbi:hypothetical protein ACHQM5_029645 [Ranunculus cassubicifolius]